MNQYLVAGIAAVFLTIAAFGGGYYVATDQYQSNLIAAQDERAAMQHERDVAQHESAVKTGQLVEARRARAEKTNTEVEAKIEALPQVVTQACEFTPEAMKLLNEAVQ